MNADLATVLLDSDLIDASAYEELKNDIHSSRSFIDKLVFFVTKKCCKDYQSLADILKANKEQYGDSDAFKALQEIIDSTQSTRSEYNIIIIINFTLF